MWKLAVRFVLTLLLLLLGACAQASAAPERPLHVSDNVAVAITQPDDVIEADELYTRLAPSIAYVDLGDWSGSGFIIQLDEQKFVVTNWHVLWPSPQDTVLVFPDGSEHLSVPLVGWDPLADVALLGPIDTDLPPLRLVTDTEPRVGADVYNLGYPDETELFPQPAMTRGMVSRQRHWDAAGITYVQADTSIAGGQSGGALVASDGRVLGITSYSMGDDNFTLAVSARDVAERVQAIWDGEDLNGLGPRFSVGDDADDGVEIGLDESIAGSLDYWGDVDVFVTNLKSGQTIEVLLESMLLDPYVSIAPASGNAGAMEFDDNSAASFIGDNAYLEYEAPATGEYLIFVDAYDEGFEDDPLGGYVLSLIETK